MWLATSLYDLNTSRDQIQKGSSSVFHSILQLDVQTCCVCGVKQVHVRGSGLCEPNCKSMRLDTEPLPTDRQFRCGCVVALQNLKALLS